jgi:hypothetical protein
MIKCKMGHAYNIIIKKEKLGIKCTYCVFGCIRAVYQTATQAIWVSVLIVKYLSVRHLILLRLFVCIYMYIRHTLIVAWAMYVLWGAVSIL